MGIDQNSRDVGFMAQAVELARKGWGFTTPNPCVGAVLVRAGRVIGTGWHRRAGLPHAEVEALKDAGRKGNDPCGATLYVTLEPCCTTGRTPPCCDAIIAARLKRVVVAAKDPNPNHAGRGIRRLRRAGIVTDVGLLAAESARLNEGFNHWIVHRTPFVTVKAAMTLDGRIATATGESKWITGTVARRHAMRQLRRPADAILVGINTVLADNPELTFRGAGARRKPWRRVVLDTHARMPLESQLVNDKHLPLTVVVVGPNAPAGRVAALSRRVQVLKLPLRGGRLDLLELLKWLGDAEVTHLLVEGGGEINGSFLRSRLVHRVAFYFAPKILGGRGSVPGVGGDNPAAMADAIDVRHMEIERVGADWYVSGRTQTGT